MRDWPKDADENRRICQMVKAAVEKGTLKKPTDCAWCGATDRKIQGHHPDYDRPLMVVWVCGPCHRAHHREYAIERRLFA